MRTSTLIIPAAGKSSRFPNMKPKWLLTHPSGRLMIDLVLDSADYLSYDRVIISILRQHCEEYGADIILKQIFGSKVELFIIDEPTRSAAHTVYKTVKSCGECGQITIKDSDCLVTFSHSPSLSHIVGLSVNHDTEVDRLQQKSFIIKNDDNVVVDILEKNMVSNLICLGVYCVDSKSFIDAYEEICKDDVYSEFSEIYVSHVISYLIIFKSHLFEYVEATGFVDWGTISDWRAELSRNNTYIFDIDGVFLKNCGQFGARNWSNYFEPIERNVEILQELSNLGHEIIFMTARPERYLDKFKNLLEEREIKYKTIIHGCNHSKRIIVNDFANTNPFPSCESISITRNGDLGLYIKTL